MEHKLGQKCRLQCIILQMELTPTPYLSVYLAEVMAFIRVVASALNFKQGYHLPLASIPVKQSTLQLLARLEDNSVTTQTRFSQATKAKTKIGHDSSKGCANYLVSVFVPKLHMQK